MLQFRRGFLWDLRSSRSVTGDAVKGVPAALPRRTTRTVLLDEQFDNTIQIGIAGAKGPRNEVPATVGDPLAVGEHIELTGLARGKDRVNVQALFDEGHETRDLGAVVLSRRTMNNFDFHSVLRSSSCRHMEI